MEARYEPGKLEKRIIRLWKNGDVYHRAKIARKKAPIFFFMDGPPYASGSIHMGTAWNKIIKDCYIRFWRMRGFNAWDQPGYDTHGTPIEVQVEKKLGFKSKKDIEKLGVGKFVSKCREFATKYISVMNDQFSDLGVWMDWEHPYLTLNNEYIEGAWYTFKKAFEKDLLFRDTYPVLVCPRCETVVAYNEVEYTKQTDTSVYVKLKVKGEKKKFLVIWTTTPWTIPANTGVMVHPKFEYVEAELGNGETWIVAKDRLQELMNAVEAGYKITKTMKGKEMKGMKYEDPLKGLTKIPKLKNAHRVVLSDRYVNLEEGTGLVHTAPGHGKEDYDAGKKAGLPIICPVGIDGLLTKETGKYMGKKARVVDEEIITDLEENNLLVYKHPHTHDYPICWRCNTSLLMISVPQWFFKVTGIRKKLLEHNKTVKWIPEYAGRKFKDWLENLGDWPVSRQRYWGIPLPIWQCNRKRCKGTEVIGSFEELRSRAKLKKEIDFHRPAIDRVRFKCSRKGCRGTMKRIPDVLDVWFDSGVATWASLGYPRQNSFFKNMWPSTFQVEGPDQFRGWWNSQMITSIMTFGTAPFKNILLHGFVMNAEGTKLSKSKGTFIRPEEVIEKHGRDVFRLYLLNNPAWNDLYFKWEDVKETGRFFTVFWNSYQFIKAYANRQPRNPALSPEDRWIISRLNNVLKTGKDAEAYQIHKFVQAARDFMLNEFSRWYIKLVRDRVSPFYKGKDRAGAQYTLNYVMERLVRALAPVMPFITEHIWQDLYAGKSKKVDSVHFQDWPRPEAKFIDSELEWQMEFVKSLTEAMAAARQEKGIKLRWPIDNLFIKPRDERARAALKNMEHPIKDMGNVRKIVTVGKLLGKKREFEHGKFAIGKVLKDEAMLRELVRKTQLLRKQAGLKVQDGINLYVKSERPVITKLQKNKEELMQGVGAKNVKFGDMKGKKDSLEFDGKKMDIGFVKAR
jgi:isoleucyl-tRNA synthetase